VLPGIVDIHGDAFERQMMPRPGVDFPFDVALIDSDQQAIAHGLTTIFHAVTWSWEPGLRSAGSARRMLDAIELTKPRLNADTRIHLRHEAFKLDAVEEIAQWIGDRRVDLFASNDHMDATVANLSPDRTAAARWWSAPALSDEAFDALVGRMVARADEVPAATARLAAAARQAALPTLSHDDDSPATRHQFSEFGVRIAEFPTTEETARNAALHGDSIVFGAPNVVRGGSHTGWTRAADMIAKGLCSVPASDYYYPAPLAAFRLVHDGILPLPQAWQLVAENPARAAGPWTAASSRREGGPTLC
jgi:alpha-D-ribose 1-methylphosphonate 5-triphosphate diphosphatase